MTVTDDFRRVVKILRDWGFKVVEWDGCYGRSNGIGWSAGRPVGHVNHHYVCSMNGSQSYINGLVGNLASGSVVNWFADVHGVAYLVGTGPMNHAGTGNQSVLDRTRKDQPPPGPAASAGSITGNAHYSGTECQHPGDSTPWPEPMVDVMVAINAAEAIVFGWTANRAINHYEWTSRKIDMSWLGGPSSGTKAGDELRRRVDARITGTPQPPEEDWFDMATQQEIQAAFTASLHEVLDENLAEIRRMVGVSIGYPAAPNSPEVSGSSVAADVSEVRRMTGVAIGYPPAADRPEHNLAQQS